MAETNNTGRLACAFCRRRKLRCDKQLPKCSSCHKFGYDCEYGPVKGPSRKDVRSESRPSHVRELERRLERVEQLLRAKNQETSQAGQNLSGLASAGQADSKADIDNVALDPNTMRELEQLYFEYINPSSMMMIHQARYFESTNSLDENVHPPIFLRYAVCALGASLSETHSSKHESLYLSSRRYLQEAELRDQKMDKVEISYAETWLLISMYEMTHAHFHRSWMSISRAVRLVQMLRLHRVDGVVNGSDHGVHLISPPRDWTEAEERRRIFWMTFLMDRAACISVGWPTLIDERDIRTYLPASDEAYRESVEERSMFLSEAMATKESQILSASAVQIVLVALCASKLGDIQRFDPNASSNHSAGSAWVKSQRVYSPLTEEFYVPQHLVPPLAKLDANTMFLNVSAFSGTISVYRAAKDQIGKDPISTETKQQSLKACLEAASNIVRLMEMCSDWDIRSFHFFTAYSVFSAALIYAECWTSNSDPALKPPLEFLINKLRAFKKITNIGDVLLDDLHEAFPGILTQFTGDFNVPFTMSPTSESVGYPERNQAVQDFTNADPNLDLNRTEAFSEADLLNFDLFPADTGLWELEDPGMGVNDIQYSFNHE